MLTDNENVCVSCFLFLFLKNFLIISTYIIMKESVVMGNLLSFSASLFFAHLSNDTFIFFKWTQVKSWTQSYQFIKIEMQNNSTDRAGEKRTQLCHMSQHSAYNFVANFFIPSSLWSTVFRVFRVTHIFIIKMMSRNKIRKTLFLSHEERAISKRSRVCTSFFFFFSSIFTSQ